LFLLASSHTKYTADGGGISKINPGREKKAAHKKKESPLTLNNLISLGGKDIM
jgi:hypothetical protein